MDMDLNRATLIGHVSKEPEEKTVGKQTLTKFSVATNHKWRETKSGDVKEKADFHAIVAWGKLGKTAQQFVHRGDKIWLEGRISNHQYEDQAGVMHYYTDIIADHLIMLSAKKTAESNEDIKIEDEPFES